jgi:hypothetical protein
VPAKISCDHCGMDVDIRYENKIYCGECYDLVREQIENIECPVTFCLSCNCDVDCECDEVHCHDCYDDLKKENKELKEELDRLKKINK